MILFEKMTDEKNVEQAAGWFKKMNIEDELQATKRKILVRKPTRLWTYAVAAAIIVLIVAGIYFYRNPDKSKLCNYF